MYKQRQRIRRYINTFQLCLPYLIEKLQNQLKNSSDTVSVETLGYLASYYL